MQPLLADVPDFALRLQGALTLLLEASACASDTRQDAWEFAVEASDLTALGLGKNELRWLVHKGYAQHAVETTRPDGRGGRRFRHQRALVFSATSCLVLTESGRDLARELRRASSGSPIDCPQTDTNPLPRWDAAARLLLFSGFGGQTVQGAGRESRTHSGRVSRRGLAGANRRSAVARRRDRRQTPAPRRHQSAQSQSTTRADPVLRVTATDEPFAG